ncbi:MAG: putative phage protein [candidate division TM6 bacterium GW2011_GWF2_30_66]|nr:MAG: putative phage protein [candidate division TM6 bacterium GW2011_GWF2_30_66]
MRSSADITGTLNVTGTTNLRNTLTATGINANTLNVTGATNLTGTLSVTGATTLRSSADITGALSVTGATNLRNTLTATGINANTLNVTGASTFNTNTIFNSATTYKEEYGLKKRNMSSLSIYALNLNSKTDDMPSGILGVLDTSILLNDSTGINPVVAYLYNGSANDMGKMLTIVYSWGQNDGATLTIRGDNTTTAIINSNFTYGAFGAVTLNRANYSSYTSDPRYSVTLLCVKYIAPISYWVPIWSFKAG